MRLRSLLLVLSFLPATGMLTGCCSLLGIDCGPGGGANTGGAGSGTFYVWTKNRLGRVGKRQRDWQCRAIQLLVRPNERPGLLHKFLGIYNRK